MGKIINFISGDVESSVSINSRNANDSNVEFSNVELSIQCTAESFFVAFQKLQEEGYIDVLFSSLDLMEKVQEYEYSLPIDAVEEMNNITLEQKAEVMYDVITMLHNHWAHNHVKDFFGNMGWEFMYLPIELIGEESFRLYSRYVELFAEKIGFIIDGIDMMSLYSQKQEDFTKRNKIDIYDLNSIMDSIIKLSQTHEIFTFRVSLAFRKEKRLTLYAAMQVRSRNQRIVKKNKSRDA